MQVNDSEYEQLLIDALRYRWLRNERERYLDGLPFIAIAHQGGAGYSAWTEEHADKQIDAARERGKG